jgi:metal-responsive CopG/Arc/MetJ family transcriptional regulator
MKVAISIPDAIFEASEELSEILGIPRSELYAKAVQSYVEQNLVASLGDSADIEDISEDWEPEGDPRCLKCLPVLKY